MAGELTQSQEVHTTYDFTTKLHKLRDGKLMIIFSPSISSALWRWPTIASACSLRCLVAWVEFGEIQQAFSRGILEQSSKQSKKFKARPRRGRRGQKNCGRLRSPLPKPSCRGPVVLVSANGPGSDILSRSSEMLRHQMDGPMPSALAIGLGLRHTGVARLRPRHGRHLLR